jgi:hypothetical protein
MYNENIFTHVPWVTHEIQKIIISINEIMVSISIDIQMLQNSHIMMQSKIVNIYVHEQPMMVKNNTPICIQVHFACFIRF